MLSKQTSSRAVLALIGGIFTCFMIVLWIRYGVYVRACHLDFLYVRNHNNWADYLEHASPIARRVVSTHCLSKSDWESTDHTGQSKSKIMCLLVSVQHHRYCWYESGCGRPVPASSKHVVSCLQNKNGQSSQQRSSCSSIVSYSVWTQLLPVVWFLKIKQLSQHCPTGGLRAKGPRYPAKIPV